MVRSYDRTKIATEVYCEDLDLTDNHGIENIHTVTTDISNNWEPYDTLDEDNYGYIEKPNRYMFTIEMAILSTKCRLLRALQSAGINFAIKLKPVKAGTSEASTESDIGVEVFGACRVNRRRVTYTTAELPIMIFDCVALRHDAEYTDEEGLSVIPGTSNSGENLSFGSGSPAISFNQLFARWISA